MLLAAAPFLAPLLLALRGGAGARRRATGLAAGRRAAAGGLCLLILRPYVADRADVAAYSTAAYASEKSWNAAYPHGPAHEPARVRPARVAAGAGLRPGTGSTRAPGSSSSWVAWSPRARRRGARPKPPARRRALSRRASRLGTPARPVPRRADGRGDPRRADRGGWRDAISRPGPSCGRPLATWCVRLALWPKPATGETGLGLAASAAALAALRLPPAEPRQPDPPPHYGEPLLEGLFGPLSSRACAAAGDAGAQALPPAGGVGGGGRRHAGARASAAGASARARSRPGGRWSSSSPSRSALQADTRKAFVPPPPEPYELLRRSGRSGGLLELPFDEWGRIASIHRMLWQPSHGRPIVAGRTGLDPAWYSPARQVFNEFPSEESLLLLRTWGIDSVLDARGGAEPPWPEGIDLRGQRARRAAKRNGACSTCSPGSDRARLGPEPSPAAGTWERPAAPDAGPRSRRRWLRRDRG